MNNPQPAAPLSPEQIERLERACQEVNDGPMEIGALRWRILAATVARDVPALLAERRQREREVAELRSATLALVALLADMHDGCDLTDPFVPQPEKCMACLAFEESDIVAALAAREPEQEASGG